MLQFMLWRVSGPAPREALPPLPTACPPGMGGDLDGSGMEPSLTWLLGDLPLGCAFDVGFLTVGNKD